MRIGIDVRYLSHGLVGGVHTYVAHFVPELIGLAKDDEVFLYADMKAPFELEELPANVSVRRLPWRNLLSSAYCDFSIGRYMATDNLDVAHFPANYGFGPRGVRTIVTLHDALNLLPLSEILVRKVLQRHITSWRVAAMTVYLHACSRWALRGADLILTDSTHAKSEIAKHSAFAPHRILPVPLAPAPDFQRVEDPLIFAEVRRRFGVGRGFVLADALKNPATLVAAWSLVPNSLRENYEIVFFSRSPEVLPVVREAVAAGHARLLLRPSREDLMALYSMADAFVFPSWIEGFGIPILEAMTCGAPVIASNRGSIPEVAGDAARLVDAEDAAALAGHITEVLSVPAEAHGLRERGWARAAEYSWKKTAEQVLQGYQQVVRAPASRVLVGNGVQ